MYLTLDLIQTFNVVQRFRLLTAFVKTQKAQTQDY